MLFCGRLRLRIGHEEPDVALHLAAGIAARVFAYRGVLRFVEEDLAAVDTLRE
jgi:hypothetical protein